MKVRTIYAIATVLAFAAATVAVPTANAQSIAVRANVPFEFYAAGKLFPAGTYILSQVNPSTLKLSDERGRSVFIPAGIANKHSEERSWVVFNQYGKVSFFSGAYMSGTSVALRVPQSAAEREVAKLDSQQSPVTVAAK